MCGIAGIARRDGATAGDAAAVEAMMAAQVHRGPDGDGVYLAGEVVLGHRRLSIIDVSPAARQPMANEDGSVWLTYNGELYNHAELRAELGARGHRFASRSDTEAIVHGYEEWGAEGVLRRMRGMFAFGLYDARHRSLLLARDSVGIKPLYVAQLAGGAIAFASELRALLRSGVVTRELDREALVGFLLGGSVAAPHTIVSGVSSLMPGEYSIWQDGSLVTRKYWSFGGAQPCDDTDAGALRPLLADSVRRHLVSDVPVGVFLSGGVDSGAIVALASGRSTDAATPGPRLTTLTIVFDEQKMSEAAPTRDVAARFGTDHREVRVTHAQFMEELPNILAAMDQPTNDGVNTYFVSKAARAAGLTVVLSGLGGDEVFWGYPHYRWLGGMASRFIAGNTVASRALVGALSTWGAVSGQERWMRLTHLEGRVPSHELYLSMRGFFPRQHVARLLDMDEREVSDVVAQQFDDIPAVADSGAEAFNRLEFKRYLHDQLLRDTDVFSMAHSIEVRVPLLDDRLVEWAAAVSPALKRGNGINKPLLVNAVDDPLITQAAAASKRGFSFPMDAWMKSSAGPLEEMASSATVLNKKAVRSLWQQFRGGRLHWSRAWALSVVGATVH